jgi:hypothetical protein
MRALKFLLAYQVVHQAPLPAFLKSLRRLKYVFRMGQTLQSPLVTISSVLSDELNVGTLENLTLSERHQDTLLQPIRLC